ncbi:MAG: glyoxalase superfamily protein [Bacteroidota bacterium]
MATTTKFQKVIPVLPSADISRDLAWYEKHVGFSCNFNHDNMYASISREHIEIHLQWHAGTEDDPLLGGSVIRIFVENIRPLFDELVKRGTVPKDKLHMNTPWGTHEFGFYDPNNNAVFLVEDA